MAAPDSDLESVVLLRTADPVRARMIRALLEEEGIAVSTPGLEHHSLLPHVGSAIEIVIRVPGAEKARARALVEEMEREVEDEPIPADHAPYRESARARPAALAPRLKRVAVVATFLCPGGGHFYVQRYRGGAAVIAGYLASVVAMALDVPLSGYLLALVWLGDVVGALEGCDVARGARVAGPRGLAPVIALGGIGLWSALALGPVLPVLAGDDGAWLCAYRARCESASEQECLLDAANRAPALPEPACLVCLRAHDDCAEVARACEQACWP